jgi:hypothetical protein
MSNISVIWQTIHQLLSDSVTQLVVTTAISIILARKSSQKRPRILKKRYL